MVCAGCPVARECMEHAEATDARGGIFGGLTFAERAARGMHRPPGRPAPRVARRRASTGTLAPAVSRASRARRPGAGPGVSGMPPGVRRWPHDRLDPHLRPVRRPWPGHPPARGSPVRAVRWPDARPPRRHPRPRGAGLHADGLRRKWLRHPQRARLEATPCGWRRWTPRTPPCPCSRARPVLRPCWSCSRAGSAWCARSVA